jgi:hypothetical protein
MIEIERSNDIHALDELFLLISDHFLYQESIFELHFDVFSRIFSSKIKFIYSN